MCVMLAQSIPISYYAEGLVKTKVMNTVIGSEKLSRRRTIIPKQKYNIDLAKWTDLQAL